MYGSGSNVAFRDLSSSTFSLTTGVKTMAAFSAVPLIYSRPKAHRYRASARCRTH